MTICLLREVRLRSPQERRERQLEVHHLSAHGRNGNSYSVSEQRLDQHAVAQPVGEPLDRRSDLRVAADEIARLRPLGEERVLDRRAPRSPAVLRFRRRASRRGGGTPPSAGRSARSPRRGARRGAAEASSRSASRSSPARRSRRGCRRPRARRAASRPSPRARASTSRTRRGTAARSCRRSSRRSTIRPFAARIAGRNACVTASWPTTFTSS